MVCDFEFFCVPLCYKLLLCSYFVSTHILGIHTASKLPLESSAVSINPRPEIFYSDYAEDYWVGDVPQGTFQVNERSITRKFEPSKFKFKGRKNSIKAKVIFRQFFIYYYC